MTSIAVVGAGFSGTLCALHLLRQCPPHVRIILVERNPQFGRGLAFGTDNPQHLLNVPAGRMSAFHDRPDDFLDWLSANPDPDGPDATRSCFVSRHRFGNYIRSLLNAELRRNESDRLDLVRGDVVSLATEGNDLMLRLDRDRSLAATIVVLALGNFPPEPPRVADMSFYDGPHYRPDPWASDALTDLDETAPVLLIGSGLTMVDTVLSLCAQGHRGPIEVVSRRGRLPRRHGPSPAPRGQTRAYPTDLRRLFRRLREETRAAEAEGASWRSVVDAVRPFTTDIWQAMAAADRARFLRHARAWWDLHRHRMAPSVADRIEREREAGRLRLSAGRITGFAPGMAAAVSVQVCRRRTGQTDAIDVDRVINCSGPACDYGRIGHPLVREMLASGMARPDAHRLGLDVTNLCAIRGRDGDISRHLFAVGPVTKGTFWEITAVPDIRRQCEMLASFLAGLVPPPV